MIRHMFSYTSPAELSVNSQLFRVIYLGKKHVSKIPGNWTNRIVRKRVADFLCQV